MSFKLLAIRPLEGCNTKFLKNLKVDQIYQFYNDYEFVDGVGYGIMDFQPHIVVKKIVDNKNSVPEDFYGKNINVSAIVGKNGSGKSALVELLIATIVKVSLIVDKSFINPNELYYQGNQNFDEKKFEKDLNNFENSIQVDLSTLKAEIYYQHYSEFAMRNKSNKVVSYGKGKGVKIRCIQLDGNSVIIKDQIGEDVYYFSLSDLDDANPDHYEISQELYYFLSDLFYSMVINYSHYGFNTNEIGEWIKGVFHKNDGYQLPIVINPYREEGNIDINSERDLAKSRFLVNILQEKKLREIQKKKLITNISIELDISKFIWDENENRDLRILITQDKKEDILRLIFEKYRVKINFDLNKENYFFNYALDYLLLKLKKITNYPNYANYKLCFNDKVFIKEDGEKIFQFEIINEDLFNDYIDSLVFDSSHIADKFKQTLFFLRHCYFDKIDIDNGIILDIDDLNNWIKLAYDNEINETISSLNKEGLLLFKDIYEKKREKYDVGNSLPSFFKIEYYFEKKKSENNFSTLSSGEKQKIFSIHSVIYHIRNLISVRKSNKIIKYENINIVFDEIELYAHPNFQRTFLSDLLECLTVIDLREHYINMIFITHSPFILSDIPKQNVLFLEVDELNESNPKDFKKMNTFGANIHDLLADSFFIGDGLIGEFAKHEITRLIDWLNDKNRDIGKRNYYEKVIELIDEPILRRKLAEMYDSIFREDLGKKLKKMELEKLAEELNYIIEPKND